MTEPLALLRRPRMPLPEGFVAKPFGALALVEGPAPVLTGFALRHRRRAVLRRAAERQALIEAMMPYGPVLVVPPGIRLRPADLAPWERELTAWLDRLEGKVQFQLTICADQSGLSAYFAERQATAPDLPPELLSQTLVAEIEAALDPLVLDRIILPVSGPEMLLNRVLLIDGASESQLDLALARIDAMWPEGLRLKLVGPSPAMSFALATLRALPWSELQLAAQALGMSLGSAPTLSALRELATARRTALMRGADPDAVALLSRIAALDLAEGPLPPLHLLEVRRDGCAAPVHPSSLPPPVLPWARPA
ncbi:GvpL/GvpF family gas vesicle protein [Salipiger marinus]|uniref:GvpL/GvpF family gas vesicle protein n=1 Tax=Salipiger marinus TaxID=555512 RepID=UPI0040593602